MLYLNSHKLDLIKGDVLYKEGDPLEGIFIIKEGYVRVTNYNIYFKFILINIYDLKR